jgi:hypothetical protein
VIPRASSRGRGQLAHRICRVGSTRRVSIFSRSVSISVSFVDDRVCPVPSFAGLRRRSRTVAGGGGRWAQTLQARGRRFEAYRAHQSDQHRSGQPESPATRSGRVFCQLAFKNSAATWSAVLARVVDAGRHGHRGPAMTLSPGGGRGGCQGRSASLPTVVRASSSVSAFGPSASG